MQKKILKFFFPAAYINRLINIIATLLKVHLNTVTIMNSINQLKLWQCLWQSNVKVTYKAQVLLFEDCGAK